MNQNYSENDKIRNNSYRLVFLVLFGFFAMGVNLKVPFSSQAPEFNWNEPWYNDCEEVSIVMVDSFYNNRNLTPAIARDEILRIMGLKEKAYGASLSENAEKISKMINGLLVSSWEARVFEEPTVEDIKKEIDGGRPVLMPVDGRKLNNRYFTTTHYHVFVISGYNDEKKMFITQEPGTYRGHNYEYSYEVVEKAMHDYDSVDLAKGRRVAIFTGPKNKKTENAGMKNDDAKNTGEINKITPIVSPNVPIKSPKISESADKSLATIVSEKRIGSKSVFDKINVFFTNFLRKIADIFNF